MIEFAKYQEWKNYWCFKPLNEVNFQTLEKLNFRCHPIENDKIKIRIETSEDEIKPTKKQIESFISIVKNQDQIISSCFEHYRNVILPVYQVATDIEDDEIAKDKSELNKVMGITAIEVPKLDDLLNIYYLIQFHFSYDCEHGLYILFKNLTAIDSFGIGDKSYEAIHIYEKGLKNDDGTPINFSILHLNNEQILQGDYYYNQTIKLSLKKGAVHQK